MPAMPPERTTAIMTDALACALVCGEDSLIFIDSHGFTVTSSEYSWSSEHGHEESAGFFPGQISKQRQRENIPPKQKADGCRRDAAGVLLAEVFDKWGKYGAVDVVSHRQCGAVVARQASCEGDELRTVFLVLPDCEDAVSKARKVNTLVVIACQSNHIMRGCAQRHGSRDETVARSEVIIDQRVTNAHLTRQFPRRYCAEVSGEKVPLGSGEKLLPCVGEASRASAGFIDHTGRIPYCTEL